MKRILFLVILAIAGNQAARSQNSDFRNFNWGTSLSKVKTGEKSGVFKNQVKDDELNYSDVLAGSDCIVSYVFNDNGKLVSGLYIFTKKYLNPQLYVQDYTKFKVLLEQKYGQPNSENEWPKDGKKFDKNNIGQEIANGNITFFCTWGTDRSIIKIILSTNNGKTSLVIHYTANKLDDLEDKEELKKALNKL